MRLKEGANGLRSNKTFGEAETVTMKDKGNYGLGCLHNRQRSEVTAHCKTAYFNLLFDNATSLELLREQHFPAKRQSRHRMPA